MPSETSPLLAAPLRPASSPKPGLVSRIPVPFRLIPTMVLFACGTGVSILTVNEIIRQRLCTLWYIQHDPSRLPGDNAPSAEMCYEASPAALYAIYLAVEAILIALGGFVVASLIARFTSQFGRKPVFLVLQVGQLFSICCFLSLFYISNVYASSILLACWFLVGSFFNFFGLILASNLIVLDTTTPSNRASYLSFTIGAVQIGRAPSFIIGALVQQKFGDMAVILTSLFFSVAGFIYTLTPIVPETFGKEMREAAKRERDQRNRTRPDESTTRGGRLALRRVWHGFVAIFDPLSRLKPVRNPRTGKTNYRLTVLATSFFIACFGLAYIAQALIGFMAVALRNTPAERGVVLSVWGVGHIIGLTILFPLLNHWGRILYTKIHKSKHQSPSPDDPLDNPASEQAASHFEVYLLIFCLMMDTATMFLIGFSTTNRFLTFVVPLSAFGVGAHPAVQAVGAASVDPVIAGEAVAALEMVGHIARFFSPFVFGLISAKTLVTMPSAMFNLMSALLLVSSALLFLIRDDDRWIPPPRNEAEEQ